MLAGAGLPAWTRPAGALAAGFRTPDSVPFPHLPPGTPTMAKIEHIVVLMMENHSFDNLLGMVPYQVPGRWSADGLSLRRNRLQNFNPDPGGAKVHASLSDSPCQLSGVPTQAWNASHASYDNGLNDGFVRASGPIAMRYWDGKELPFTYSLVESFPFGQRYFCSMLGQTYPNRRFFFTGTASGTTATDSLTFQVPAANGTLWDRLDQHGVNWGIYYEDLPSWLIVPGVATPARASRVNLMDRFYADAAAGRLPQFTFLDPNYLTTSEENPQDIQVGERFMAKVTHALMRAPTWKHTALFITYDEHGGYYDHVPPPAAIAPDSIQPIQPPGKAPLAPGGYDRYGFRVPTIVVSPWAKPRYISRALQDHTSITAFVERKWNLPAMTFRDANAQPMTDYFNFRHAAFAQPPHVAGPPPLAPGLKLCARHGLAPPLTPLPGTQSDVAHYLARAHAGR